MYPNVDIARFFCVGPGAVADLSFRGCVNLAKGAVICADRVLTVSPHYAWEIQTLEGGWGLHEILRAKAGARRLAGIANGIDDIWDPEVDPDIAMQYWAGTLEEGKRVNKASLQRNLGLREDP